MATSEEEAGIPVEIDLSVFVILEQVDSDLPDLVRAAHLAVLSVRAGLTAD